MGLFYKGKTSIHPRNTVFFYEEMRKVIVDDLHLWDCFRREKPPSYNPRKTVRFYAEIRKVTVDDLDLWDCFRRE